jgi:hypothetical protein
MKAINQVIHSRDVSVLVNRGFRSKYPAFDSTLNPILNVPVVFVLLLQ